MAKKQKAEIKEKSIEVLKKDLEEARKELFNLNLDNKTQKLKNPKSIFMKRKEIARILTMINSKPAVAKAMADKGGSNV